MIDVLDPIRGGSIELVLSNYQSFARKLIQRDGPTRVEEEDIRNEDRVVTKLMDGEWHCKNIVDIFRKSDGIRSCFSIDMELCGIDLQRYILESRLKFNGQRSFPQFVRSTCPTRTTEIAQLYNIMKDIANGVAFIHSIGEVHRDLKPSNGQPLLHLMSLLLVLWSIKDSVWKLTDFGFMSSGPQLQISPVVTPEELQGIEHRSSTGESSTTKSTFGLWVVYYMSLWWVKGLLAGARKKRYRRRHLKNKHKQPSNQLQHRVSSPVTSVRCCE